MKLFDGASTTAAANETKAHLTKPIKETQNTYKKKQNL
jgi:hypothetical protein